VCVCVFFACCAVVVRACLPSMFIGPFFVCHRPGPPQALGRQALRVADAGAKAHHQADGRRRASVRQGTYRVRGCFFLEYYVSSFGVGPLGRWEEDPRARPSRRARRSSSPKWVRRASSSVLWSTHCRCCCCHSWICWRCAFVFPL